MFSFSRRRISSSEMISVSDPGFVLRKGLVWEVPEFSRTGNSNFTVPQRDKITALSMAFCNSRTFPDQSSFCNLITSA